MFMEMAWDWEKEGVEWLAFHRVSGVGQGRGVWSPV
jgi:hypothetical protein